MHSEARRIVFLRRSMKAMRLLFVALGLLAALALGALWLRSRLIPPPSSLHPPPSTPPATVPPDCPQPLVTITDLPLYGATGELRGQALCAVPALFRVAVYIYNGSGWWTKPTFDSPTSALAGDGTWAADVTTGEGDEKAMRFAAFLVPVGVSPPALSGQSDLPPELLARPHVIAKRTPGARALQFSGRTWLVRRSDDLSGPGPNYFADDERAVWVDAAGRLHLALTFREGRWQSAEVYTAVPLGYGTYTFVTASPVDRLDPNVVLGLFTWDELADEVAHREMDVEFARWGDAAAPNAQFVVQPEPNPGNRHRFSLALQGELATHTLRWGPFGAQFATRQGLDGSAVEDWTYTGRDLPPPGASHAHINLWLLRGQPPSDGQPVEMVIQSFQFEP